MLVLGGVSIPKINGVDLTPYIYRNGAFYLSDMGSGYPSNCNSCIMINHHDSDGNGARIATDITSGRLFTYTPSAGWNEFLGGGRISGEDEMNNKSGVFYNIDVGTIYLSALNNTYGQMAQLRVDVNGVYHRKRRD